MIYKKVGKPFIYFDTQWLHQSQVSSEIIKSCFCIFVTSYASFCHGEGTSTVFTMLIRRIKYVIEKVPKYRIACCPLGLMYWIV